MAGGLCLPGLRSCGVLEKRQGTLPVPCEKQLSVTAGTIFHGSKKPLAVWFKALWWFSTRKAGVNAVALKELLGLGSYQTAWCWLQKLRTCTIFPDREALSGQIEADEFYLGGERSGKRGAPSPYFDARR